MDVVGDAKEVELHQGVIDDRCPERANESRDRLAEQWRRTNLAASSVGPSVLQRWVCRPNDTLLIYVKKHIVVRHSGFVFSFFAFLFLLLLFYFIFLQRKVHFH
ncbi:unnamed protein product [Ixodes pacificus]